MTETTQQTTERQPGIGRLTRRFTLLHLAWLQSIVATAGSLYFSEVMFFQPCVLCWLQRIFMYPLVLILGVGVWRRDPNVRWYALPLSLIGLAISLYHNAMQYGIIPPGACSVDAVVSCTTPWINWFGFVSIPLLAFVAFTVISVSLVLYQPRVENAE